MKDGSKSDRIDARKLAELLHGNKLHAVYHGEHGVRTLKELGRSYLTITKDLTRVMSRIKALYRSWAIPCSGATVYSPRHRAEWLAKIPEPGVGLRAERLYQQLDLLQPVRQGARRDLLVESHKHPAVKLLRQIPSIGPIRAALLVALLQTPHRFRTKRQLWAYSGFAVETHDSGEYRFVRGKLVRNRERITVRGLNHNHNHDLKNLFKGAAISASTRPGSLRDFYVALLEKGTRPTTQVFSEAIRINAHPGPNPVRETRAPVGRKAAETHAHSLAEAQRIIEQWPHLRPCGAARSLVFSGKIGTKRRALSMFAVRSHSTSAVGS